MAEKDKSILLSRKRNKIISEASKLGAIDPQDVLNFVNFEDLDVETGDFEGAVKKIADVKKYLFKDIDAPENKNNPLNGKDFSGTIKKLSPQEIATSMRNGGMSKNFGK